MMRTAHRFFVLAGLTVSSGLNSLSAAPVNSIQSVVLQGKPANGLAKQCSRQSPSGNFAVTPVSTSEKTRLDSALPSFLKERGVKTNEYYYQFAALTRGKKRLIYINAFRPDSYSLQNWKKTPIVVCDGGKGFWGVEFDPANGKFQNLAFNGMA